MNGGDLTMAQSIMAGIAFGFGAIAIIIGIVGLIALINPRRPDIFGFGLGIAAVAILCLIGGALVVDKWVGQ